MAEDTVGNVLGVRGVFDYANDSGVTFKMQQDRSVALAVGNAITTVANLPTLRVTGRREISPRYLLCQQVVNPKIKKRVVVGDVENALWTSSASSSVTINALVYTVTGRIGEKRSTLPLTP